MDANMGKDSLYSDRSLVWLARAVRNVAAFGNLWNAGQVIPVDQLTFLAINWVEHIHFELINIKVDSITTRWVECGRLRLYR